MVMRTLLVYKLGLILVCKLAFVICFRLQSRLREDVMKKEASFSVLPILRPYPSEIKTQTNPNKRDLLHSSPKPQHLTSLAIFLVIFSESHPISIGHKSEQIHGNLC